jgi:DNA-binding NarL/FixJ family response regulator
MAVQRIDDTEAARAPFMRHGVDSYAAVILGRDPLRLDLAAALLERSNSSSETPSEIAMRAPGVLIFDVDADGDLAAGRPNATMIRVSEHEATTRIRAALDAGAPVYVIRSVTADDLPPDEVPHVAGAEASLTRREIEVLNIVSEGRTNAEVAARLWVSEPTIKFHLSNIFRKLGVTNRTEAAHWAQLHVVEPIAARGGAGG